MKLVPCLKLVFILIIVVQVCFIPIDCANPNPPGGGPRDSLPPLFMGISIPFNSTQVQQKKIAFYFNENVSLLNAKGIMINPINPKNKYQIYSDQNRIIIAWEKKLDSNTTYSIFFNRYTVADLNERNVYPEQLYVKFSTGASLDTNVVYGAVLDANNGRADSTLLVVLYKDLEDSAVVNKHPQYMTTVDTSGRFAFWNVAGGKYRIYAVKDPTFQGKYLSVTQEFAFVENVINVLEPVVSAGLMYSFKGEVTSFQKRKKKNVSDTLILTTQLRNASLSIFDSIKISFNRKPKNIDLQKIHLIKDSIEIKKLKLEQAYTADSTFTLVIMDPIPSDKINYQLILDSMFVSGEGELFTHQVDTISFSSKAKKEYGGLFIRHQLDQSENNQYILNLRKNNKIIQSIPLYSSQIKIPLVLIGEYTADILVDKNNNGRWDAGSFWGEKRQPEISIALEEKILILPEEETEFIIEL